MILIDAIIIMLLILTFINFFIMSNIMTRLKALEKITRETISLIGKTAMSNMGMGMGMNMGKNLNPAEIKPSKNPMFG